jgi:hypothetical protein
MAFLSISCYENDITDAMARQEFAVALRLTIPQALLLRADEVVQ